MLPTTLQIASVGCPLRFDLAQRRQRVGRLARLRDGEDDACCWSMRRIAIAELAGVFDLDRDAGELLEQVFADQGRVLARAAGGEDDPVDPAQLLRSRFRPPKWAVASASLEPAAHRRSRAPRAARRSP